jgi:hypothetical protein
MQIDITALFQGQTAVPTKKPTTTQTHQTALVPIPTTNLIDLTDLETIASEDYPMALETDIPTSSGMISK